MFLKEYMIRMIHIGYIYGPKIGTGMAGNVWSTEGIAPVTNGILLELLRRCGAETHLGLGRN